MSESIRQIVGDIYCEVLFELAQGAGSMETVQKDLASVVGLLRDQPEFAAIMRSQTIKAAEKSSIIQRVFAGKISDLTVNFLSVLVRRDRMRFLDVIADKYEIQVDIFQKRALIEVTLSRAPGDETIKKLREDLSIAINGHIKLVLHIDANIIGGIIIKKGERVIDNSVRSVLQRAVKTVVARSKEQIYGPDTDVTYN